MPDIWMDVDAALAEVPVNIFPLIDDTDFKTRETGVAYNAAGMDLVWNFVTTAGAYTQTAVTPTTGGNYDWAHKGNGMYSIEIPASGGASINNDTEGFGWFSGVATGVLPWRGPIIGFRKVALNDALIDGNVYLETKLNRPTGAIVADAGNTTATFKTNLTEAVDNFWIRAFIKFTSGALINQVRKISGYNGTTKFITVDTVCTSIPAGAVTFVLIDE